ncbi:MAG TPA: polymorphic toxin-type HINT domain-containing protein, partial [Mycobacteriales bacterium]
GGLGRNLASRALGSCANSFSAGTGVLMADGSRRAIQDVRIGDRVIATNPLTGRTVAEPVTDVIVGHGDRHLVAVSVDTDGVPGGRTATLTATDGHPFWVDDQGRPIGPDLTVDGRWVKAGDLRPGEWLDTPGAGHLTVLGTRSYTRTTTVYNLTVDGVHTFYVEAGDSPVLVHNCPARFVVDSSGSVTDMQAAQVATRRTLTIKWPDGLEPVDMSKAETHTVVREMEPEFMEGLTKYINRPGDGGFPKKNSKARGWAELTMRVFNIVFPH